ncbi:DUF1149 family protein [Streptococcus ovis]|uniref:DUF1149 family protein n=1 Tax=Streptococcus ovis TaxID=82806 RepID=UPI0003803A1E|nr:DUF1149 family protein [Streptococcus ovis]
MEVVREKEFVNQYHFDARNRQWEEEHGVPETRVRVDFHLMEKNDEEQTMTVVTIMNFMIVLDQFVISGLMTQGVHISNRIVEGPNEFSDEEKHFLVEPLIDMLKRLTYEVTEIAFDAPGVKLEM